MPRFVILFHTAPPGRERGDHFDLMLEAGDALRSWSVSRLPLPGETVPAEQLADHRLAYLDYEGPVSGGRGTVTQHDAGSYEIVEETDDQLTVRLAGLKLRGILTLRCCGQKTAAWQSTWQADAADCA